MDKPTLGSRADWHQVFMAVARAIAMRSKDATTRVGAVIVATDNQPIGMGFNGFPKGAPDADLPVSGKERHLWTIHAEENAVLAAIGMSPMKVSGARVYTTHKPCARCLRLLGHVGIRHVIFGVDELSDEQTYESMRVRDFLGINVEPL